MRVGRPKVLTSCEFCRRCFGTRELRRHVSRCDQKPPRCKRPKKVAPPKQPRAKPTVSCRFCGADVPQKSGKGRSRKFCSKRCRWKHGDRTNPSKTLERHCARCGNSFRGDQADRFCSRDCAWRHRLEVSGRVQKQRLHECPICRKLFMRKGPNAFFCGQACYRAATKAAVKRCLFCAVEFSSARRPDKKYCSRKCSKAAA